MHASVSRWQLFPLLRVALMLIVGVVLGDVFKDVVQVEVWQWLFVVSTLIAVASMVLLKHCPMWQSAMLFVAIVTCGCWRFAFCIDRQKVAYSPDEEYYEAVVAASPTLKAKSVKHLLLVTKGRATGHYVNAYFPRSSSANCLSVGDGLRVFSRLENPVFSTNLARRHFNYERWLQVRDVVASTYVEDGNWQRDVVSLRSLSLLQRDKIVLGRFRERLLRSIDMSRFDESAYSLVAAMSLGEKTAMSADLRDVYSVVGVSHILALSGMHLAIIYALLSLLFVRKRFLLWRVILGNSIVLLVIWAYAIMVGGTTSIMRSAIMFTIITISTTYRSYNISLNTFGMTLLIMLFANPLSLWDIGFQMSFVAVFGILMCNERLRKVRRIDCLVKYRSLAWCWSVVKVSLSAQLLVAPLVLYYWGRFSCYFLLANFVAIPLATMIVVISLLFFVVSPLPWVQGILASVLQHLATFMNKSMELIASLPGASVDNKYINDIQLASLYVIIVAVYMLSFYAEKFYRIKYGYGFRYFKP